MEDFIDREVHRTPFREVNTEIKLVLSIATLLVVAASPTPWAPLLSFAVFLGLSLGPARVSPSSYFRLFSLPGFFAAVTFGYLLFFYGHGDPLFASTVGPLSVVVTDGNLNEASLVLSRFLGGTSALLFLAFTTPPTEIFASLRRAGLPPYLVETALLIYRYAFILLEEGSRVRGAQEARGGYSSRRSYLRSLSLLSTSLFVRTWDKGKALDRAMRSRCYSGEMPTGDGPGHEGRQVAAAASFLLLLVATSLATGGVPLTAAIGLE